ncbi:TPA: amino acid adenylation domain-containing protein [Pseudomonas putida]|uniref:Amino acid adenylation domain protein n=1 Tax=Pseudomonas putida (strain GB-1) TaxID=76869 RepID=B0KIQ1_PSEPG|nr:MULTISPECIES: amino acid adenylation domain-containing protein [Pseudomonas]ABY99206.1 amino acid adenylation domain protein [Pseudomonas putida GB-1]MBP0706819.1 amino acid adenylation domain-containing protein [Pseudomonas sp. T34]MCE1000180.1 amino acid adenylation domain-containing protein [Pseudomonas sp. NMI1173_11]MCK2186256.1 amino acid adenylation domain-containing protein [Pseudomonas sp. MB04B]MDD2083637.1 amino acid adenylation domain-containing protein [Pseudomonas putida]
MPDLRPNPTLRLEYRAEQPIHQAFLKQASRCPDATAIIAQHTTCSYTQLEQISQGIAAFLVENAASGADRVVIVASRSAALVYAMLGCLRAGLAFTVADAAYPAVRIKQIVSTLKPAVVLRCGEATVDAGQFIVAAVPEAPTAAQQAFPRQPVALPAVSPEQPAYITFTSGSTGEPKGIVTHHAPLVHFIDWHVQQHGFTQADTFSLLSGLGHDPVYRDVFTPLSIGATLACPAQSTLTDPSRLASWIHQHGVSVIHLTPPLGKLIETGAHMNSQVLGQLRYLFWGGDALSPAQYQQVRAIAPNAVNVNFYGTTETPQAMAFHTLEPEAVDARVPLGKGIADAQLLVVNPANQLVSEGETGEILIRSPYLSLGYWNDPALTEAKFIANPFTGSASDRCYRTGDLGTYLADGSASFLGRGDSQVKIRGHRIELAEIENAITRQPHIGQCVLVANQDGGATRLVAYCVAQQATRADELRQALAGQLPDYMVPALFVFLDALPLTPNGKVDKRALPAPFDDGANQALSPLAEKLSTAWARILQVPRLDARLSFVELGGDSISFVQASRVLEALIGHLPERWETLPVCQLAELSAPPKGAWRVMEMPVFVRMLAIILIVVGHLSEFDHWLIVGETSVLFLVSGISLARFQLKAIEARGDARTLLRSLAAIVVPTLLYTALIQLVFDRLHWQSLLLVSNWFPASEVSLFNYWYIEVLVQMIVIIGLLLSIRRVRRVVVADPFRCLIISACALVALDVLINQFVFDASALLHRVPQHFLAVMVLGMAVHHADTTARKWVASAVAVLVVGELDLMAVAGVGWEAFTRYVDIALPAMLALIWFRSVPVPALVARAGAVIASSTLFIYLTHFQFQSVADHVSRHPLFEVALALAGGVLVAYCWNTLIRLLFTRRNKHNPARGADPAERATSA